MKTRRPSQPTSAAAISAYLRRRGISPVSVRSDVLENRWIIVVNCHSTTQVNQAWVALREGGYDILGCWHSWLMIEERPIS